MREVRAVGLSLVLCGLTGCSFTSATTVPINALTPQPSGPVALALKRFQTNAPWALADERGQVVLLDIWATWCEACRDVLPQYAQLQTRYADRGLKVYAVTVDADAHEVEQFIAETHLTLPVLSDPDAHAAESVLKVKLMPTSFLVDRRGVIRFTHEGVSDDLLATEMRELETLLAEPAP